MKVGFYAGSFDPFTIGHLHVVKVASKIFDKVVVGIGVNPKKTRRFDKIKMNVTPDVEQARKSASGIETFLVYSVEFFNIFKDIGVVMVSRWHPRVPVVRQAEGIVVTRKGTGIDDIKVGEALLNGGVGIAVITFGYT